MIYACDCFQYFKGQSAEHSIESRWLIDHQKVGHYIGLSWVVSQGHVKRNNSYGGDRVPCEPVDLVGRGFQVADLQAYLLKHLVVYDIYRAPVVHQNPMYIIVGHHRSNDQGVAVGMIHVTSIIIAEGDVVILPLEVFYRPLVRVIDISDRSLLRFPSIVVSSPMFLQQNGVHQKWS